MAVARLQRPVFCQGITPTTDPDAKDVQRSLRLELPHTSERLAGQLMAVARPQHAVLAPGRTQTTNPDAKDL